MLSQTTRVIQIDSDPWELAKNFPVAAGIQGNIKVSLAELAEVLQKAMSAEAREAAQNRVTEIAREKEDIISALAKKDAQEKNNVPISVSRLMQELKKSLELGTLVVDDCWSSSAALRSTLDFAEPGSFQRSRGGGSIGWGLPGALGVKLGALSRPVVAVCGDGSAMWSIQSLWSAAHYNIPVTYIIIANASYRQVKMMRRLVLGHGKLNEIHAGMDLDEPMIDFCKLAQGMGIQAERVEQPEKLRDALKSALKASTPRLIEVIVENAP